MIRPFQDADMDDAVDAWYQASLIAHPFLDDAFIKHETKMMREVYLPSPNTWVYEKDGKVVGFIGMMDNEVGGIFVHPDYQGQGVGRTMMDHVATMHDELVLSVFKANPIGRRFYDAYGFKIEHEHFDEAIPHTQLRLKYTPQPK
jgi:putative acetyltransferase